MRLFSPWRLKVSTALVTRVTGVTRGDGTEGGEERKGEGEEEGEELKLLPNGTGSKAHKRSSRT